MVTRILFETEIVICNCQNAEIIFINSTSCKRTNHVLRAKKLMRPRPSQNQINIFTHLKINLFLCVCLWLVLATKLGPFRSDSEVYFWRVLVWKFIARWRIYSWKWWKILLKSWYMYHSPPCSITEVNLIVSHGLRIDIAVGRWKHIVCPAYWISGQLSRYYQFSFHEMNHKHNSHRLHLHGVTCCEQTALNLFNMNADCGFWRYPLNEYTWKQLLENNI